MTAYYNEIDPFKAEVLREAIKARAIAPGEVDERSIADVEPSDLVGFTQCHFFAGGGFWSLALRYAGWPDERPVWTGSCPCPSFSAAGKGRGFDDPRHLWPEWFRLIRQCGPGVIFGEQAAAAIGHGWLDLVCGDLEAEGYAVAAAVLGAHSVGAPHIRQRLYFCADTTHSDGRRRERGEEAGVRQGGKRRGRPSGSCDAGLTADTEHGIAVSSSNALHSERRSLNQHGSDGRDWMYDGWAQTHSELRARGEILSSGDTSGAGLPQRECDGRIQRATLESQPRETAEYRSDSLRPRRGPGWLDPITARSVAESGATRGFWADCDWWYGRDGKYRPIGPGLQPLAHGSAARVGRLRMYGDGIVVQAAQAFIESYLDARG